MDQTENKLDEEAGRDLDALFGAILYLRNLDDAQRFFRDLLTENELLEFAQRWKVAQMLALGVRYITIAEETGMSSTTIARVHKWLKSGKGGYQLILSRQKAKGNS